MKNILKVGLVILLFLCASTVFAKTKKSFSDILNSTKKEIKEYTEDSFYDKFEFTNKKTGAKRKFGDFSTVERRVFIILAGEKLNQLLLEFYEKWQEELKTAEESPKATEDASKNNIEKYMEKLLVLRKEHAEKLEKITTDLFKDYPDKFTQEEKDFTLKRIRDFNDKYSLITR